MTYKAVTVRSGDVEVTNSAVLKGEDVLASTVTTGTFKIKASATANGRAGTFTLIKLDSSDARKNLAGAEFTLYKFDMDNIDATPATVTTLKTDEDGRVTFGEGTMDELEFDVLFCYVETKKLRQAISWIILLIISCLKETVLHRATSWQSIV